MTPVQYRQHREQLGLTQAGLAALLGLAREAIVRREAGTQRITREAVVALRSFRRPKTKGARNAAPDRLHAEAIRPEPGEQIHAGSTCADCGRTSHDFGRFRKAEPYERADEDGAIYECGYCGGLMIVPPPVASSSANSGNE